MSLNKEIKTCVEILKKDGIILYPTDTVWGIGCDATNRKAVEKIYKLKKRAESKSMIILLNEVSSLHNFVETVPENINEVLGQFNKPTTVIYEGAKNLAKNVIPTEKTVAIRIANHDFCQQLIKEFGKPIVSTSANISGQPTPMYFSQISEQIKNGVDYVVEHQRDTIGSVKPSTIIKFEKDGLLNIIRP
jgi:L-threonylcarbamoyladenylate synthase